MTNNSAPSYIHAGHSCAAVRREGGAAAAAAETGWLVVVGGCVGGSDLLRDGEDRGGEVHVLAVLAGGDGGGGGGNEGNIRRVGPDFGSTLTVSSRGLQSNCWVNWKVMGQPCEFQVTAAAAAACGWRGRSRACACPAPTPPSSRAGPATRAARSAGAAT